MPIITGTIVDSGTRSRPAICYDNLFLKGGSTVATGTNYQNALDWLPYDSWTTAATSGSITFTGTSAYKADFFAIAAHTLHSVGGSISLEYYDGSGWVEVAAMVPGDQYPMIVYFDEQYSNQWRVQTVSTSAAEVGIILAGSRMALDPGFYVGYSPTTMSHSDVIYNNVSQQGNLLGRSVLRRGITGQITIERVSPAFMRDDYLTFMEHALTKGWFHTASQTLNLQEVAYCWTTQGLKGKHSHPSFMDSNISFEGISR